MRRSEKATKLEGFRNKYKKTIDWRRPLCYIIQANKDLGLFFMLKIKC